MDELAIHEAKRRLVELLKRQGPMTAVQMAARLQLTDVAIRQHLVTLEEGGLVQQQPLPAQGRGRPSMQWSLTERAQHLFPDRHGELTVGLVDAMRQALGEEGLERVLQARADQQVQQYGQRIKAGKGSLKSRVEALAAQRTEEGYLAEVTTEQPGSYLLIEHHCPICEAAKQCAGLCRTELDVFRRALGDDVQVERLEHLLSDGQRCVYRICKSA